MFNKTLKHLYSVQQKVTCDIQQLYLLMSSHFGFVPVFDGQPNLAVYFTTFLFWV